MTKKPGLRWVVGSLVWAGSTLGVAIAGDYGLSGPGPGSWASGTPTAEIRLLLRPKASTGLETGMGKPARYLRFKSPALESLGRRHAALPMQRMCPWDEKEGTVIVRFPRSGHSEAALIEAYRSTGAFDLVESDGIGYGHGAVGRAAVDPDDAYFPRQYGLKNPGTARFNGIQSKAGADIKAVEAWDIQPGSEAITVAVLDCGLNANHPDIAARVWVNTDEIPANGKDDDGNGFIDDVNGWSFANDAQTEGLPGTAGFRDDFGHGTNVAGIIGAIGGNSIGLAGVARCTVMPVKVLNKDNWGYFSWWAAGIRYAVDNGARILNLSLGGEDERIATLRSAVEYALSKNVILVASMGNERRALAQYPAAFPGVIAVGATGPDDKWVKSFPWDTSKGSNFGPHISVCAPGNIIYGLHYSNPANYESYWSGTSQAAPHVAGVCALLLSQDPARKPADIKRLLELGADDGVGADGLDKPGFDEYYGFGRVNAKKSLLAGVTVGLRKPLPNRRFTLRLGPGLRDVLGRELPAVHLMGAAP